MPPARHGGRRALTGEAPSDGGEETLTFTVRKTWLFAAAGVLFGFVVGYGAASLRSASSPPPAPPALGGETSAAPDVPSPEPGVRPAPDLEVAGDPALGPEDAPVTIVEFTDYQCPFCARHHRTTKPELLREYDGRVRYVVKNFPLRNIHPLAQKAAEAAECAGDQDRFWDYADLLFERAPALRPASLVEYAAEVGMDRDRFRRCLTSGEMAAAVESDFREGRRHGVRSTPTFFLNGRPVVGAKPLAEFQTLLEAALGTSGN